MVAIQLTDSPLGLSYTEKHGNFSYSSGLSISRRPIFGIVLRKKQSRTITTYKGKAPIFSAVIEKKEFEFKPSFDEYLKAMESVKSKRVDRQLKKMESLSLESKENSGQWQNGKFGQVEDGKSDGTRERQNGKFGEVEELSVRGSKEMTEMESATLRNKGGSRRGQYGKFGEVEDRSRGMQKMESLSLSKKVDGTRQGQNGKFREAEELSVRGSKEMTEMVSASLRNKGGMRKGQNGNFGEVEEERGVGNKGGDRVKVVTEKKIGGKMVKENNKRSKGIMVNSPDDLDRAAFRLLEENGDAYDKPRITRAEMEERIQRLAKCLNGADIDMPEWMFSRMMRSAKIRFSDHSILRLIQILGKLGNWKRVLQVIEWVQTRERFKSHKIKYIYTTALNVLKNAKRPVEALNLFRVMQQQMSSYPDLVAYHCIAVTLGQAGYIKEIFDVIDSMRSPPRKKFKSATTGKWDPRLEPDVVVYNAVLNACVHRKNWEGAFWVLQQLKQQNQKPSSTTYGLVMEVMFACEKYNLVHEFFMKVQKSSIPNALNYKVLVNTLWKEGKLEEAVLAVKDMERRGIVGTGSLYYDLAHCLCSAGRSQEALMQIDKICKVASRPLVVTYTGLIQACLDVGDIENATYIFSEMHKFCSPNLITCNIMLKAYLDHRMFDEANKLFLSLLQNINQIRDKLNCKNKVVPDVYTFNTMLDVCSREQRWDDLEFIYIQMLKQGFHFNAKKHLRMILDASNAGKGELLEATWKHLVQSDRAAPPLLVRAVFCRKLEQGNYSAAVSCITDYPFTESQVFSAKSWLKFFTNGSHRLQNDTLNTLLQNVNDLTAKNDSPNHALQNLAVSCKEYLRN